MSSTLHTILPRDNTLIPFGAESQLWTSSVMQSSGILTDMPTSDSMTPLAVTSPQGFLRGPMNFHSFAVESEVQIILTVVSELTSFDFIVSSPGFGI